MGEEAEAFLHLLAPHLQHQVQPAPGLGPFRHLGVGRGLLGPQGEGEGELLGPPGRGQDPEAHGPGHLDRRRPQGPRRRLDQDLFPGPGLGPFQGQVGGEEGDGEGGGLLGGEALGQGEEGPLGDGDPLGEAALGDEGGVAPSSTTPTTSIPGMKGGWSRVR